MELSPKQIEVLRAVVDMNDLWTKVKIGVDLAAISNWTGLDHATTGEALRVLLQEEIIRTTGRTKLGSRTFRPSRVGRRLYAASSKRSEAV